ncbi:MAG: glycosyltransferase [Ginsengibacter sp.]
MLSVIIPCYNSGKHIRRAIDSVLNQTYLNYEIILVDNNSSDNTIDILDEYNRKHPGTVKVFNEPKQGSPCARNKGLFEAKGEWIQFLDADDELLPEKFASQIAVVNNSIIDVVVAPSCRYKILNSGKIKKIPRLIETEDFWKGLLTSKLGITSANLWRKKALLSIGGWNENLNSSQEYDLLFRLLKNNAAIGYCSLIQTIVHITPGSISFSQNENRIVEIIYNSIKLRMDIKEYLDSKGMLTKELVRYADMYNYSTLIMIKHKPLLPLYFRKGKIPMYVKKTIKENHFDIPFVFKIKLYVRRILNIAQKKFFSLQ